MVMIVMIYSLAPRMAAPLDLEYLRAWMIPDTATFLIFTLWPLSILSGYIFLHRATVGAEMEGARVLGLIILTNVCLNGADRLSAAR